MTERKVLIKRGEYYNPTRVLGQEGEVFTTRSIVCQDSTGARTFRMGMTEIEPGNTVFAHCHDCEEAMYVLEGEGVFVIDGKEYPGRARGHRVRAVRRGTRPSQMRRQQCLPLSLCNRTRSTTSIAGRQLCARRRKGLFQDREDGVSRRLVYPSLSANDLPFP